MNLTAIHIKRIYSAIDTAAKSAKESGNDQTYYALLELRFAVDEALEQPIVNIRGPRYGKCDTCGIKVYRTADGRAHPSHLKHCERTQERRQQVVSMRRDRGMKFCEIGAELGISGARAQQLYKVAEVIQRG